MGARAKTWTNLQRTAYPQLPDISEILPSFLPDIFHQTLKNNEDFLVCKILRFASKTGRVVEIIIKDICLPQQGCGLHKEKATTRERECSTPVCFLLSTPLPCTQGITAIFDITLANAWKFSSEEQRSHGAAC